MFSARHSATLPSATTTATAPIGQRERVMDAALPVPQDDSAPSASPISAHADRERIEPSNKQGNDRRVLRRASTVRIRPQSRGIVENAQRRVNTDRHGTPLALGGQGVAIANSASSPQPLAP